SRVPLKRVQLRVAGTVGPRVYHVLARVEQAVPAVDVFVIYKPVRHVIDRAADGLALHAVAAAVGDVEDVAVGAADVRADRGRAVQQVGVVNAVEPAREVLHVYLDDAGDAAR